MNDFSVLVVIIGLLAIGQIVMAVYISVSEKEFLAELARTLGVSGRESKSWSLWHRALKKSQNVLSQAELEGIKVVADTKFYAKRLEGVYENELRLVTAKMEGELESLLSTAQQDFGKFLAKLQSESERAQEKKSAEVERLMETAMVAFTKRLEESLSMVSERVLRLSQAEGVRAKSEAAAYRTEMIAAVEKDITEIIDEVVKKVVGKRLDANAQAQVDLIGEALEQAKKDRLVEVKPL